METLRRCKSEASASQDARMPAFFKDIDLVKLFGSVEDLFHISLDFATVRLTP
jgi:hypothetical protein